MEMLSSFMPCFFVEAIEITVIDRRKYAFLVSRLHLAFFSLQLELFNLNTIQLFLFSVLS